MECVGCRLFSHNSYSFWHLLLYTHTSEKLDIYNLWHIETLRQLIWIRSFKVSFSHFNLINVLCVVITNITINIFQFNPIAMLIGYTGVPSDTNHKIKARIRSFGDYTWFFSILFRLTGVQDHGWRLAVWFLYVLLRPVHSGFIIDISHLCIYYNFCLHCKEPKVSEMNLGIWPLQILTDLIIMSLKKSENFSLFQSVSVFVSSYTMTAIAVDRYQAGQLY